MTNSITDKPAFLIAGPKSNSGKTIVTLGLLQAFRNRGLQVQAFKCGPDYIDPMHHTRISGRPSYNLDKWMSADVHVKSVFTDKASSSDVAIVEGVMGLFDGARRAKGSSAEVAKLLDLPVVLVVDASSVAYSIAPLLYGFKHFDPSVNIAGVIFNKVSGDSHYQFLKEAADDVGLISLGYLPRNAALTLESRHLGLFMPQDEGTDSPVQMAAELLEKHVDIDMLLNNKVTLPSVQKVSSTDYDKLKVIAVAQDEAFNFMYPANIDALQQIGKIVFFSPLNDAALPKADVVWLPGGYPELYAQQLTDNTAMRQSIVSYAQQGGTIIAECGGMIYAGDYFTDKENTDYKMCQLFDYSTTTQAMKLTLGYRRLHMNGEDYFGHEFHYSRLDVEASSDKSVTAFTAREREANMPVYRTGNVWASYMHLYLGEPDKMRLFLDNFNQ